MTSLLDLDRANAKDFRAYIIIPDPAAPGRRALMWHRKRKRFVPYFDSQNPAYASVGTANRTLRRQHWGWAKDSVSTMAVCEMARQFPEMFLPESGA